MLLRAVAKHFQASLALLQLFNAQAISPLASAQTTPPVPHPFAGAAAHELALAHAQRLGVLGCGCTARAVQLLCEGNGCAHAPSRQAARSLMRLIVRRVAAGLAAATPEAKFAQGLLLYAAGQYRAAAAMLEAAAALGHVRAHADLAWMLLMGREGVAVDCARALRLAEEGGLRGCMHSAGVLAWCCMMGCACHRHHARALQLAGESAAAGSRYGQAVLGALHWYGWGGLALDLAQALALYRAAAAQGLDEAQCRLGAMHAAPSAAARDLPGALRWFIAAAQQGHPEACFRVAVCYELGSAVAADAAQAVCWHRRAAAGGHVGAARALQRLTS